jgi:hypothetical protein
MAKHRIFTVGFALPGDEFEYVEFDSDTTLLDADVVLLEPTLGNASGNDSYNGKTLLSEYSSFSVKQHLDHWRSEIIAAVKSGKLVIVYLAKKRDCYRYTGQKQHSGTGRSRVTTNIVTEVSSYEAIPNLNKVTPKSGTEIQIDKDAKYLAPYWSEFSSYSRYEVEIEGDFKQVILRSRSGNRTLGAAIRSASGALLFLPPLRYDKKAFVRHDKQSGQSCWTEEALQFGKRLVAALSALATSLKQAGQLTPPPAWTADSKYRLASEGRLEAEISECSGSIAGLQAKKASLENDLLQTGSLRHLLFEQGNPLEAAILEALRLFGFDAQPFVQGESEFDCVFVGPEGRCLGEAEGKDNKAINIDKFSQLERNLQEDYARDDVTEYAKGALFGNGFRLLPISERGDFFTEKCVSAAKRIKAALVRTPDLFVPANYLKENPTEVEYAKRCREAIFGANGEVVAFPAPPTVETSVLKEQPQSDGAKPNIQVNADVPPTAGVLHS